MKKYLAVLCASLLCACCLVLAACGGGGAASSSAAAPSASASAASESAAASSAAASEAASSAAASESSSAQADPAEKFVGEWKIGAMESQGVTMTGDMSSLIGEEVSMDMTIAADGTGSMSLSDETADITWVLKDENTITVTVANESDSVPVDVEYTDGVLSMIMDTDDIQGKVLFSKDGKIPGMKEISLADAKPITSKDQLVGTWRFTGLVMMGVSIYGDGESLSELVGSGDTSMTFKDDGTVEMSGDTLTYTVDANGATLEQDGKTVSILASGDDIVIDLGAVLDLGMEMVMLLSK